MLARKVQIPLGPRPGLSWSSEPAVEGIGSDLQHWRVGSAAREGKGCSGSNRIRIHHDNLVPVWRGLEEVSQPSFFRCKLTSVAARSTSDYSALELLRHHFSFASLPPSDQGFGATLS